MNVCERSTPNYACHVVFASWFSDQVYPLSTGLTFWRVPSCHRAKWCGSWRVLPSGQRCLSLAQSQRTGSEFLWWSLKTGTPTGTKRMNEASDHVNTSQWLDIHSQSDMGVVCRGHMSNAKQGAVCLQSEWMAALFADMPDILYKPSGAKDITSAYSVGTMCGLVYVCKHTKL